MCTQPEQQQQSEEQLGAWSEECEGMTSYDDDGVLTVKQVATDVQPSARRNLAIWWAACATKVPMWWTASADAAGAATR